MSATNLDDSVTCRESGISNQATAVVHDKTKPLVAIALAASILALCYMGFEWRQAVMESRLQQYNLDWFKSHEFSDLNGKVQVQDRMILALQVSQACKK
jgi:hypothetical protein